MREVLHHGIWGRVIKYVGSQGSHDSGIPQSSPDLSIQHVYANRYESILVTEAKTPNKPTLRLHSSEDGNCDVLCNGATGAIGNNFLRAMKTDLLLQASGFF